MDRVHEEKNQKKLLRYYSMIHSALLLFGRPPSPWDANALLSRLARRNSSMRYVLCKDSYIATAACWTPLSINNILLRIADQCPIKCVPQGRKYCTGSSS